MKIEKLSNAIDIKRYLKEIGVDAGGIEILASKAKLHLICIRNMHVGAANILKQDALSIGADLAVPRGTVIAKEPYVDTLLIASTKALQILAKKELAQPFGLKDLAKELHNIIRVQKPRHAKVMGVINANDDSFYSKSRFLASDAIKTIKKMIEEGAEIIDIGAVSSRPNSVAVMVEEELRRIEPILRLIAKEKLYEQVAFSVDSYQPRVIKQALDAGFSIVNDITGLENDAVCRLVAQYKATAVIMHMQGTPQTMQKNPHYENVLDDIYTFFQERIQKAEAFGVKDIILDVGIGFGKSVEDNFTLIAHLEHFLSLQKEILVGASRKSLIDAVSPSKTQQRLAGTLALHLKAFENGASILRVHDVFEHVQALKIEEKIMLS
jgi:dihydropteroate synthase